MRGLLSGWWKEARDDFARLAPENLDKSTNGSCKKNDCQLPHVRQSLIGNLLITRSNTYALVGLVCLVKNHPPQLMLSDKSLALKPNQSIRSKKYILLILSTPFTSRQIQGVATGSIAGMKNISQDLKRKNISSPSLPKQEATVATIIPKDKKNQQRFS